MDSVPTVVARRLTKDLHWLLLLLFLSVLSVRLSLVGWIARLGGSCFVFVFVCIPVDRGTKVVDRVRRRISSLLCHMMLCLLTHQTSESVNEKARHLGNKEEMINQCATFCEARLSFIQTKEDDMTKAMDKWLNDYFDNHRKRQYHRNRQRITDIRQIVEENREDITLASDPVDYEDEMDDGDQFMSTTGSALKDTSRQLGLTDWLMGAGWHILESWSDH